MCAFGQNWLLVTDQGYFFELITETSLMHVERVYFSDRANKALAIEPEY
jgi:hypothetical protein